MKLKERMTAGVYSLTEVFQIQSKDTQAVWFPYDKVGRRKGKEIFYSDGCYLNDKIIRSHDMTGTH